MLPTQRNPGSYIPGDCNKIIPEGFRYAEVEALDLDPDLCCCSIPQAWGAQDLLFIINVDITQIRFHSYQGGMGR